MIFYKTLFTICASIICILLSVMYKNLYNSESSIKKYVYQPIGAGIITVIIYSISLFCTSYYVAMFFITMYFCCNDFLTYIMLKFTRAYSNKKEISVLNIILKVLIALDCISLFANIYTLHSFDINLIYSKNYEYSYWSATLYNIHILHLALCYFMVIYSFLILIIEGIKAPSFYKQKYFSILIVYIFVIVINFFCYALHFPIDYSVLCYVFLGGFICYYTIYSFPKKLMQFLLSSVNEKIDDGIIFFDKQGKYVYSNNITRFLLRNEKGVFTPQVAEMYAEAWKSVHPEYEKNGCDSFTIAGAEHHFIVEYQTLTSDDIEIGSFFKLVDKTEETNEYLRERYNATHDSLTGLYNRLGFFDAVENLQIREKRQNERYIMLCSNIKDFKIINEIFGEKVGDSILLKQANLMKGLSHTETICGRINDDKFAMFLKKEYFDERKFIESINAISKIVNGSAYKLKIIVGIYETSSNNEIPQLMCDKAEMACIHIEDDYQNIFSKYNSDFMGRVLSEKNMVSEFSEALITGQFLMYLQPQIINVGTPKERFFGAEALVRWNHPVKGLLLPEYFLSVLEKTGLIYKLDIFIWEQAAKKIKEWNERGLKNFMISVNVSPKDQYYIDICKTFVDLVNEYEINPKYLRIEFIEGGFMENFATSKKLVDDLKANGFIIEIDDFGSGYSSFNMLKDIDVDALKIDKIFLKETENHNRSYTILSSIISMSETLGMDIIAEGVETIEHVDMLLDLGCRNFQGNFFSEPITVSEFERLYL